MNKLSSTSLIIVVIVGLGLVADCFILTACQSGVPDSSLVIVEWTTESEVDMAGFNLYRSETPDGPYLKVNTTFIPGASDPILGGH